MYQFQYFRPKSLDEAAEVRDLEATLRHGWIVPERVEPHGGGSALLAVRRVDVDRDGGGGIARRQTQSGKQAAALGDMGKQKLRGGGARRQRHDVVGTRNIDNASDRRCCICARDSRRRDGHSKRVRLSRRRIGKKRAQHNGPRAVSAQRR